MPESGPRFIGGLELSRSFYREAARPLLEQHFPSLLHAAALLGAGSDVFGFDTEMSTDHDWGPSVVLFLREAEAHLAAAISKVMALHLPPRFHGFPTHSVAAPDDPDPRIMAEAEGKRVQHQVFVTTAHRFVNRHLAVCLGLTMMSAPMTNLRLHKPTFMAANIVLVAVATFAAYERFTLVGTRVSRA